MTSLAASFVASTGAYSDSFNIADFSVSASPSFLSIPQGGSVNTSIIISSLNLFSGTVTLSAGLSPQNGHFSVCFNGSGVPAQSLQVSWSQVVDPLPRLLP